MLSKESLQNFAQTISNHEALEEVRERIKRKMFDKFLTATDEERRIISDLLAHEGLFYTELRIMAQSIQEDINDA